MLVTFCMGKILGEIKLLGISDLPLQIKEKKLKTEPETEPETENGSTSKGKYRQVFKWLRNDGDCL